MFNFLGQSDDLHTVPTSVCTRTQGGKAISRQPIFFNDYDYDYVLEVISCQDEIEFERYVEVYSDNTED